ncbi:hypothetical protein [Thermodesulforhabdus norvegica]|uniref:hypothetical protein n=1 Tax=Thermodesulforhabdus norvegica TaxID=39841 RepID=UPI000B812C44|nr:hypothetical protein [Thermodesulforhabdus norvegica]
MIRFYVGEVAWQVSCPALGGAPVRLFHENDRVLGREEKAQGYVVHEQGTSWMPFLTGCRTGESRTRPPYNSQKLHDFFTP